MSSKPTPVPGCLAADAVCKSDASLGNCCSSFCLQLEIHDTGFCKMKPTSTSTATGSGAGLAIGLTFAFLAIIALLVTVVFLLAKMKKKMLTKADIYRFLRGAPEQGGLDLPMHEKVDIMPYDASYEIIPSKFTIENQILGAGEFGVVKRGCVKLMPNSEPVSVAVKTTADGAEVRYVKALLSELKLMIYIGAHPNVVTLIGACTTDLKLGRAYLFLELCSMGSLENYLRKNKHRFTSIVKTSSAYANVPQYMASEDAKSVLTIDDLNNWSLQIAQGLEYLSAKKVVHGDLASRNVLLVSRSHAKISDFGLSRRVYDYTNYVKKQQEPLPWKWMAIESLQELTFSTQSDVWAFGVTLWEIYSLGSTPYPGLTWSTDFVGEVLKGLRLPRPMFGTQQTYDLLLECWNVNPTLRPSPTTIQKKLVVLRESMNWS